MNIKTILFISCCFFLNFSISQTRTYPVGGQEKFQDSILKHNEIVRRQFEKTGLIIAAFNIKLDKAGNVKETLFIDSCGTSDTCLSVLNQILTTIKFSKIINGKRSKGWVKFVYWFRTPTDTVKIGKIIKDTLKMDGFKIIRTTDDGSEARFIGGESEYISFLYRNTIFPERCINNADYGYIRVSAIVKKDGSIEIKEVNSTAKNCPEYIKETIRLIREMEPFIPAHIAGKRVISYKSINLNFDLSEVD